MSLMQKLLSPRPALLLVPRARARTPFVRQSAVTCTLSRRLVTVAGLQSWFAGSPRKEVRWFRCSYMLRVPAFGARSVEGQPLVAVGNASTLRSAACGSCLPCVLRCAKPSACAHSALVLFCKGHLPPSAASLPTSAHRCRIWDWGAAKLGRTARRGCPRQVRSPVCCHSGCSAVQ